MHGVVQKLIVLLPLLPLAVTAADNDTRRLVELPPMLRQHMLGNMRDHLLAITEIQQALSSGAVDQAADIAERRIGMSSLATHGASHMAAYLPEEMQVIGTRMHQAASRFAVIAQESAVDGDIKKAIGGLAQVTAQCVACHAAFRTQ
jgi:hypothetical protein